MIRASDDSYIMKCFYGRTLKSMFESIGKITLDRMVHQPLNNHQITSFPRSFSLFSVKMKSGSLSKTLPACLTQLWSKRGSLKKVTSKNQTQMMEAILLSSTLKILTLFKKYSLD